MILRPILIFIQQNLVSMGTESLSSKDVKQLVGLDECVCLPLPDNRQGQVGVFSMHACLQLRVHSYLLHMHICFNCINSFGSQLHSSVSQFNTRVKNTACFDHLVQANVRNKKLLKDAVQNITAKGITNYTKGFEFAFEQLNMVSKKCFFVRHQFLAGTQKLM